MLTRLQELRVDSDRSQRELADFLHVHQTTYSDYERGDLNIPLERLCQLADFYGTSVDYLLFRTDVKTPYAPGGRKG